MRDEPVPSTTTGAARDGMRADGSVRFRIGATWDHVDVVSHALAEWQSSRKARIDDLLAAHASLGGSRAGRRWRTEQLNWALVLKVAGEFQGFSRTLHNEAVEYFATQASFFNAPLATILRNDLTFARGLDRGNASPSNLGKDFDRLGMQFWPGLRQKFSRAPVWNETLTALNEARNAIAHDDHAAITRLTVRGWPLSQLETIRRFHRAADSTAKAMDTVVGSHLHRLFGGSAPW